MGLGAAVGGWSCLSCLAWVGRGAAVPGNSQTESSWKEPEATHSLGYEFIPQPVLCVAQKPSVPGPGFALGLISSVCLALGLSTALLQSFQGVLPALLVRCV